MDAERFGFETAESSLPAKFAKEGLTFDDVLLVPAESSVLPNAVSTATRLTRTIALEVPVVSAAMDTVTEARMAIALAREGGLGIIQRNLSIEAQVAEVDKVKRSEAGMIVEPLTLPPDALLSDALEMMEHYHVSGVPITDPDGVLVGILTNRDLRFERNLDQPISALMTSRDLVTALWARHSPRPSSGSMRTGSRSCRSSTPTAGSGAHHGEGHPEARRLSAVDEGCAWPVARRRRGRSRRRRL